MLILGAGRNQSSVEGRSGDAAVGSEGLTAGLALSSCRKTSSNGTAASSCSIRSVFGDCAVSDADDLDDVEVTEPMLEAGRVLVMDVCPARFLGDQDGYLKELFRAMYRASGLSYWGSKSSMIPIAHKPDGL